MQIIRLERDGPDAEGLSRMACDPPDTQSPPPIQHLHVYCSEPESGLTVRLWDSDAMESTMRAFPVHKFA